MAKERMIPTARFTPDVLINALTMGAMEKFVGSITPNRILKSGIATVVFWNDGSKTVVKRGKDEPDDTYAAFTAALAKKVYGSNSKLKRLIAKKMVYQDSKKGDAENE